MVARAPYCGKRVYEPEKLEKEEGFDNFKKIATISQVIFFVPRITYITSLLD